jgi:hypothetical protein
VRFLGTLLQPTRLLHAMPANKLTFVKPIALANYPHAKSFARERQSGTAAQCSGITRLFAGLIVLVGLQACFQPPSAQLTAAGTMSQPASPSPSPVGFMSVCGAFSSSAVPSMALTILNIISGLGLRAGSRLGLWLAIPILL